LEIEVDAKALLGWFLLALIVLGLVFAASHGGASLVEKKVSILLHGQKASPPAAASTKKGEPPESPAAAQATPRVTTDEANEKTAGEVVSFEDLSSKWDWTVSPDCASRILDFLSRDKWVQGHKIEKLVIGLVDERAPEKLRMGPRGEEYELTIAAALPVNPRNGLYEYQANAGCTWNSEEKSLHCYVAPSIWHEERTQLSVVALVSALSAAEDALRPKSMDAWYAYSKSWRFSNYEPLISQEEGKWRTDCLEIRPQG